MKKRILSLILVLTMLFGMTPSFAMGNTISDISSIQETKGEEVTDDLEGELENTSEEVNLEDESNISIRTDLKNMKTKGDKLTFDLWAKDSSGNKIDKSNIFVTNNGKPVAVNWDDSEKTSYTLNLELEDNKVIIEVSHEDKKKSVKYLIIRKYAEDGEVIGKFIFSLDAFTISLGYIIEPMAVDIHKGWNAAQELDYILTKMIGINYENTGTLENSFYLSQIYVKLEGAKLPKALEGKGIDFDKDDYNCGKLGEFSFNNNSGWMYSINNTFPNVGFADKYPQDGDVMRVQFTLALGNDIGGGESMGGDSSNLFPSINRDELTRKIAESEYDEAREYAIETIQKLGIYQQEINNAIKVLDGDLAPDEAKSLVELE